MKSKPPIIDNDKVTMIPDMITHPCIFKTEAPAVNWKLWTSDYNTVKKVCDALPADKYVTNDANKDAEDLPSMDIMQNEGVDRLIDDTHWTHIWIKDLKWLMCKTASPRAAKTGDGFNQSTLPADCGAPFISVKYNNAAPSSP